MAKKRSQVVGGELKPMSLDSSTINTADAARCHIAVLWDESDPANVYTWRIEYLPFLQNIVPASQPGKMLPGKMIIQSPPHVVHRWRTFLDIRKCERPLTRARSGKNCPTSDSDEVVATQRNVLSSWSYWWKSPSKAAVALSTYWRKSWSTARLRW